MVEIKGRIAGRDEGVSARIATNGEMPAAVDAQLSMDVAGIGLHDGLEVLNIVVLEDQAGRVAKGIEPGRNAGIEVALEASGIITERVCHSSGFRRPVLRESHGADVDSHVCERPGPDTATARSGGEGNQSRRVHGLSQDHAAVGDELSVSAEGCLGAIENGRSSRVANVKAPLPIRNRACMR